MAARDNNNQERSTMRAIVGDGAGKLHVGERPVPKCKTPEEVLIRVEYSALNRADLMQRAGNYTPPPGVTDVLGLECVGRIVEGDGSSEERRVLALLPGGGYAQFAKVYGDHAIPLPDGITTEQAAAITEVWATAYQVLHLVAQGKAGETILIHAGSSGVGQALIQLSRHAGLHVISTAGSKEKLSMCAKLGSDCCINYKTENFETGVKEFTKNRGVDIIADPVGASNFTKNVESAALDARCVLFGLMGGSDVKNVSLRDLLMKRVHLLPTTLRSRSNAYKTSLLRQMSETVFPAIKEGLFDVPIDKVFPMSEAADAHAYMEANRTIGKILLRNDL